jgi:serine/threonine protein kinase
VSLHRSELPTILERGEAPEGSSYGGARAAAPAVRRTPSAPPVGESVRVGSCDLYFELATGGMATVFIGIHHGAHGFEKVVAVKRLLPAMSADEASISSFTGHACIRDVFDLGMAADGTPYLVMEFLVGEPLSRVCGGLRRRPDLLRTPRHRRVASRILAGYCRGIHAAHELSDQDAPLEVVHRDLTPENLFALHDGTVRVTDFGIMRARVRRQRPSAESALKGKTGYMSPEYLERKPYDRRSDVWSLGVVLWELLTGQRLFRKSREADTMLAILHEPIPAPSSLAGNVDRRLDDIVAHAVTRCVEERYATAAEMARELEAYLASTEGVGPTDVGGWLHEVLPDSLTTLTALVDATLCRRSASREGAGTGRPKPEQAKPCMP